MNDLLKTEILNRAATGQLMVWLTSSEITAEQREHAISCMAQLHGARELNVLSIIHRPSETEEWRLDYASWSQIYRNLLPLLNDNAGAIIDALVKLGTGIWEYTFIEAFHDWCSLDETRCCEVLELEADLSVPETFLTSALIVSLQNNPTMHLPLAIDFAQGVRRSRTPGFRAMAMMSVDDNDAIQTALATLAEIAGDEGVLISARAEAFRAALELARRCAGRLNLQVSCIIEKAIESRRTELLIECCNILARSKILGEMTPSLLKAVQIINLGEPQAVTAVDTAIYMLLQRPCKEQALECLDALIGNNANEFPKADLSSSLRYLAGSNDQHLLPEVICRWLGSGDGALCSAARRLINYAPDRKLVFNFSPQNGAWSDARTLYLARKAIGWLMPHETAPASFVVCLLAEAGDAAREKLADLLFDPLLVNYPIATRSYLDSTLPNLPPGARTVLEATLIKHDLYLRALEDVGFVPELQPSDRDKAVDSQRQADLLAEASENAEGSSSSLMSLFHRQTLLYGKRAVSYAPSVDGSSRRMDSRLASISVSTANPMGWTYDPFGLDYSLRVFRAEKAPQ